MTGHLRRDSVTAERLLHSQNEAEEERGEGGRKGGWVHRVVQAVTVQSRKCDSALWWGVVMKKEKNIQRMDQKEKADLTVGVSG